MGMTRLVRLVRAPRERVYRALIDPDAVAKWKVPSGMTCRVHEFDAREGGSFRVSLTYESPTAAGKTSAHTDTYRGHFARLVPFETVEEVVEFETADPSFAGPMRITIVLTEVDGDTQIVVVHDGLPPGLSPEDNEVGWSEALSKFAALAERA